MFPVVELSGTPQQRGYAYGQAQPGRVRHSIASYARLFAFLRGWDWAESRARAAGYLDVLTRAAPHLLDEMRGIALGADREFDEILALNVRTELLAGSFATGQHSDFEAATARNIAAGVPQHPTPSSGGGVNAELSECTTVAALPGASRARGTWLAQNWDWTGDQRAACVLLRVRETGRPDILTLAEAGMVGKSGINSAGVAVALNILASQLDGQQPGMPVHVLLRLMLECDSLDAAVALAHAERSGASSCITVAERGQVLCLEITPAGVGKLFPANDVLVHSNHCVTSTALPVACPIAKTSTTRERYARAEDLMNAGHGKIDADYLQRVLRDEHGKPLCINREPDMTLHPCLRSESVCGLIMDLDQRIMYVAPDVPSRVGFVPLGAGG
jgi:isopenicillin-N N-acyltransferase like protein